MRAATGGVAAVDGGKRRANARRSLCAFRVLTQPIRARRHLAVDTALCAEPDVSLTAKEALYRIAQEALHNTAKHAGANVVRVSLTQDGRELVLRIEDDGRGFDPGAAYPGHLGLRSMRERAERAGGTLSLGSVPERGAVVRVVLPLPRDG